jgi:hypothetical protein
MSWFNRTDKGILTPTESKREVPDGFGLNRLREKLFTHAS